MKVFLGGTCNGTNWRERLVPGLRMDYFNPVVEDWNEESQAEEVRQRESCDFCLYVITPDMTGVYSIAEVIDDSNKRPAKTIFSVLDEAIDGTRFTAGQAKSLLQVARMVEANGGAVFSRLEEIERHLNRAVERSKNYLRLSS